MFSKKAETILDSYIALPPSAQNALDLFQGEWSSRFPPPLQDLTAGPVPLFEDVRMHWMFQRLGGVNGYRVLELGPLEGGHSYMLDRAGAASVLAIEANTRAYLKCLLAKELLTMNSVRFRLGDFRPFLDTTDEHWDLCLASGILYHMREPVHLLEGIAEHADRLYLWTHYFNEDVMWSDPNLEWRFEKGQIVTTAGYEHVVYRYNYGDLEKKSFCGGSARSANWLTREGILGALKHFGYREFSIDDDRPYHIHGPCFAVLATR